MLLQFCLLCILPNTGNLRGEVRDAQTGEPLERVRVEAVESGRRALTDSLGTFLLAGMPAGDLTVRVSTIGYRLLEKHVTLTPGGTIDFEFILSPDTFRRTDSIEVHANRFGSADRAAGDDAFTISGSEAKNLASVLADDPLRAVQSIPGVTSNDDFEGRFSLHGASYERVGLYLDGVLLHSPLHTVEGEGPSGSIAVFNGDMVDEMALQSEGYPARYSDRTAGALDVRTREGSRTQTNARLMAGAADAGAMAEGPLGRSRRGSWLASVRKSYLQYLMQRTSDHSTMAFGFLDEQAQLSYDLGRGHSLKLGIIDGTSSFDRSHWQNQLALNTSMLATYHFSLANLGWQYAPRASFLLNTHAAFIRERYDDTNRYGRVLGEGFYGEWAANSSATWMWSRSATLEFGASARRIRGSGFADYYFDPVGHTRTEGHRGNVLLAGGYAQQTWNAIGKRLYLSAGARWDRADTSGVSVVSPQASIAFLPWRSGRFHVSWGQYAQFPDVHYLYSVYGGPRLLPERATHNTAGFEQSFGELTRLRIEAYRRDDRDLLFRPYQEARILGTGVRGDNFQSPLTNSLRGYAEGIDFILQRRTANRLTGWISYSLGYTQMRDGLTGLRFPSDQDQRHTVNVYLGYRIRPSVNLSTKWTYGSGFPVPGFFQKEGGTYFLAPARNAARLGAYERTDVRLNKERLFDHWKMTIYAEVVNVFNRANYRFDSYNGYDPATRQAYLSFSSMFPVLPSAGLMIEF